MTSLLKKNDCGRLVHQMTLNCPHYSEKEEPFFSVSLSVKNKGTLVNSLESFSLGEEIPGYLCHACGLKSTANRRTCFKTLPDVFFVGLQRMELDFETMTVEKICHYLEFPQAIDFTPFTADGLDKKSKEAQPENATSVNNSAPVLDADEESKEEVKEESIKKEKVLDSGFTYKLVGILVHEGTASNGHYYSFIQNRGVFKGKSEGSWYEFNLKKIRPFDPNGIPAEAFGGDKSLSGDDKKINSKTAYMLVYERSAIVIQSVED